MSKICTKCGNVVSDDAQVCARCGKSFSTSMNNHAGHQMANQRTNPSGQQSATPQWNNRQWNNQSQSVNRQWNNQSQSMNRQWNNQGTDTQPSKARVANLKNKVKQQEQKLSSGNKKVVLIGLGAVAVLIILFIVIAGGRKPSNRRLKNQLPMDVLTYKYDGQTITSKVKSLKVEKRILNKNFDTAYCKVTLEDEYMTRILYLEINSQKYTQGGWNITGYSLYGSDEVYENSGAEKKLDEFLDELSDNTEVTILNVNKIENSDGSYTFEIDEDSDLYSGTEIITIKLINISEYDADSLYEVEFPMEYGWSVIDYDNSQLKYKNNN